MCNYICSNSNAPLTDDFEEDEIMIIRTVFYKVNRMICFCFIALISLLLSVSLRTIQYYTSFSIVYDATVIDISNTTDLCIVDDQTVITDCLYRYSYVDVSNVPYIRNCPYSKLQEEDCVHTMFDGWVWKIGQSGTIFVDNNDFWDVEEPALEPTIPYNVLLMFLCGAIFLRVYAALILACVQYCRMPYSVESTIWKTHVRIGWDEYRRVCRRE